MKKLVLGVAILSLAACSSVTIQPEKITKLSTQPTYQDSRPFFLWGLVGEERVDVKQVCGNSRVLQMQSQATFTDALLGGITFGIYAPHTVKVWCDNQANLAIPMETNHAN
ncbi:Bor family protein [Pseudoalteromonas tunicata]|jgi:hypothetical protein|uniref:Bor family protein n=1 Tax=Pseudoalteromonas tunicata D2 TaxID=87626 RepID=A4CE52_9GAMM|nr:Bor family protein [Pseudoalteromonas tunicata]ATC93099.1 hypothetical protein PTUN_a0285 [Pseudoalteromonas tunicata]AXT32172.1 Bor family protein [Pseudoalteromonas tunicata]EAR26864.1 hypothetical protein PTD2_09798 [Pseudoalteromonas tunicata D2]MDP4984680.1 Bor family protein [Pseudoalteromonas tunicata]MDP5213586.1 Bor family protein [Pseudoalteromonas tunicata]